MNLRMRSMVALVWMFAALASGLLWWQSSLARAHLREQVLLQAGQRSLQLAGAMAGHVDVVFGSVDLVLQQLREHWLQHDRADFGRVVTETLATLPAGFVTYVVVSDAEGRVVFDSLRKGEGISIADRDHFRTHLAGGDRMVIGQAVRSRFDGSWVIAVSRPLLLQGGRFAGTVHLALSTEYIASKLAALSLSEQDVVALIHPNGTFLARSRDNALAMGQRVPADLAYLGQLKVRSGEVRVPGIVDTVPRTYGWYRLEQSGTVLAIGLADASVLGPLASALQRGQWVTAGLCLLILTGGGLIAALLWRVSRGEVALRASEAGLKQAQRLARVGNWVQDHRTGEVTWSDEVFRIFGLDPARHTASYERFMQLVHPEDRECLMAAFKAAEQTRQPFDAMHRLLLPDGTLKYVQQLGVTEFAGERPLISQGTVQDLTEMHQAQLALRQLNDSLEQRVDLRTRELGVLNEELEVFAYSVSHDLRTPLRTIHGFASLLEEEGAGLTDTGHLHLRRIREAAKRMGQLITDLLTMAQHSRAVIRHERVDLSEMARLIAAELEQADPGRGVQWTIEDGLVVRADPMLMGVVLQNLLGNAWKYTRQTGAPRIRFARTQRAAGMEAFCVSDNGAGFDMAHANQLFQPFKRLHTSQQFEGSGVGLASVLRVVQRHGGQVRGEGAVGQGAAFYFSLPEGPEPQPERQPPEALENAVH